VPRKVGISRGKWARDAALRVESQARGVSGSAGEVEVVGGEVHDAIVAEGEAFVRQPALLLGVVRSWLDFTTGPHHSVPWARMSVGGRAHDAGHEPGADSGDATDGAVGHAFAGRNAVDDFDDVIDRLGWHRHAKRQYWPGRKMAFVSERTLPEPTKLLQCWMEWEDGVTPPGRVISNLKTAGLRDLLEALVEAQRQQANPDAASGDAPPEGE
jgi:hypothetical protein